jgi:Holliday junction DNA helicase RuvA
VIESLHGRILALSPDLLLAVGPVTLRLEISEQTRRGLGRAGEEATVFAEMRLREEQLELIGFARPEERGVFRLLTGVSGVGKRLALAILSELGVADLARVMAQKDEKSLTRISGVGAKTASRLLLELGAKLDEFLPAGDAPPLPAAPADPRDEEALLALTALGLSRAGALEALSRIESKDLTVEEIIRRALSAQARS